MSDTTAGDSELAARALLNAAEMYRAFARVSPVGEIAEYGGLVLVYTGPLLPFFNCAILTTAGLDAVAALDRAARFFRERGQGWALLTVDRVSTHVTEAALARGMAPTHEPVMVLDSLAIATPPAPGLEIRAAHDAATLREYNDTMTRAFGGVWAMPGILQDDTLLRVPEVTHYTGYLHGVPVATAMRLTHAQSAGIYNVGVVPEARHRGIGEAITRHAAVEGVAEGCRFSSLQATPMGEGVYRRIGYRTVATSAIWPAHR